MSDFVIINQNRALEKPLTVSTCVSALCHLVGLSFRKSIPDQWGLLFDNGRDTRFDTTMHTMWMRFELGMVWITEAGEVVDVKSVKPWKVMIRPAQASRYVLELLPERAHEFHLGDKIKFEESA